jgi:hypothetical protein
MFALAILRKNHVLTIFRLPFKGFNEIFLLVTQTSNIFAHRSLEEEMVDRKSNFKR